MTIKRTMNTSCHFFSFIYKCHLKQQSQCVIKDPIVRAVKIFGPLKVIKNALKITTHTHNIIQFTNRCQH